ncbi:C-type lectin domain family 4 member M-like [Mercenaria mercenaria]|uniref:C-type lectin domain family 4 member M-like n=1 Tax=Mercenaria mercenaria TaxID=6596 RepID=UPI00234E6F3C|nr:C-type lectin domain family 4 member M-like [Mercenaria mercenaria]
MHKAVKIAVFLLLSTSKALSDCPDGWLHHGSSCYHISHDKEPMITASASCQHMGCEFVEIESAAENAFLFAQIKPLKIEAWLGLNDIQEETIWHWYGSNRPLTSTGFKNWHSGEPNNLQDDENCALMSPANGQWYDGHCHVPLHYICEKSYGSGEIVG